MFKRVVVVAAAVVAAADADAGADDDDGDSSVDAVNHLMTLLLLFDRYPGVHAEHQSSITSRRR